MLFSQRLKELMEKRKISWTELCKTLNIGKNQQAYWRKNDSAPDGSTLVKLADFFDVTTDYLLGIEKQMDTVIERTGNVLTNSISESPSSTLIINQNLSKQEQDLIELFRELNIEQQYKILSEMFAMRGK